jgi:hypothetical protein
MKLMIELHQYGVAMPGGTEVLFHARDTVEELARMGLLPPLAVVDVDLVNCFGSLEWDAILEAYKELLPEAVPWERWSTEQECDAVLPSGARSKVNRGAGQGEPDGPLKASVALGHAMRDCKSAWQPEVRDGIVDMWLMDDGQLLMHPKFVDPVLRSMDNRLARAGATRGTKSGDGCVKSMVRVYVPPGREQEVTGWETDYIRDTCNIVQTGDPITVLGGVSGSDDQVQAAFEDTCSKVDALHRAIDQVQDAATEVVLKKSCADVSKIVYSLRLNGDRLAKCDKLQGYSTSLRDSLARSLGGALVDTSWRQAVCGRLGLGFRTAEEVALPAFIASRTAAAPAVRAIFARLESAGLAPPGALDAAYVARTDRAIQTLIETFGPGAPESDSVTAIVRDGLRVAEDWWAQATQGFVAVQGAEHPDPAADELEDDEPARPGAPHIQKKLCAVLDAKKFTALRACFLERGDMEDVLRLEDLNNEHQEHSWLWALNPVTEPVLSQEDWLGAVRLRLGCPQLSSDILCASCGTRVLDRHGYHALCCARGESTKGHNKVRDTLHAGFAASDPGAAIEVQGLIASQPDLRPADILTTAAREHGTTAVDVGICAPHASGAGEDCVETMRSHKLENYASVLSELEAQNIQYVPATISCYGRRHPSVTQILIQAAREAARRKGLGSHNGFLRRWYRLIAADVWRRAARMIAACAPKEPRETELLAEGEYT